MAKFKDFGAGGTDPNAEPIKFTIHGEEFVCLPEIQGKVLLELIADSGSDDAVRNAEVSNKFFIQRNARKPGQNCFGRNSWRNYRMVG